MLLNAKHILLPNSEYDRRQELTKAFEQNLTLTPNDLEVLQSCTTEDHEAIGLIGCLLKDNNYINKARLLIASLNRSNIDLSQRANSLLNSSEEELELLINQLSERYILKDDELTLYENKVYTILFGILSNRELS